jgi:crossover junction endodeoxyribonuclease RuvC
MLILGIDPGTRKTGYGLIEHRGGVIRHLTHGVISTRASDDLWTRIHQIHQEVARLIDVHEPTALSIERCFVGKNVSSALKLGHTRGAIIVAAMARGLTIHEYAPTEVKSAVTGYGRADKDQVAHMVRTILTLPKVPPSDAADALACAVCHAHGASLRGRLQAAQ